MVGLCEREFIKQSLFLQRAEHKKILLQASEKMKVSTEFDTEPLLIKGHNPTSKKARDFSKTGVAEEQIKLLDSIRETSNFALRLGQTIWKNNDSVYNPQNSIIHLCRGAEAASDGAQDRMN